MADFNIQRWEIFSKINLNQAVEIHDNNPSSKAHTAQECDTVLTRTLVTTF